MITDSDPDDDSSEDDADECESTRGDPFYDEVDEEEIECRPCETDERHSWNPGNIKESSDKPKHIEPPPPSHYLDHFPKHPGCSIATLARLSIISIASASMVHPTKIQYRRLNLETKLLLIISSCMKVNTLSMMTSVL